ncbi:MAG: serine/threonine-protein kinase [Chlamydiae bacterium]|nr:serine/threonine-protein kinase [Chlamydiota bacterium]
MIHPETTHNFKLSSPLPPDIQEELKRVCQSDQILGQLEPIELPPPTLSLGIKLSPLKTSKELPKEREFAPTSFLNVTPRRKNLTELPLFRATPSPGAKHIGPAIRLFLSQEEYSSSPSRLFEQLPKTPTFGKAAGLHQEFQSLKRPTFQKPAVCLSKVDEFQKYNQDLHQLIHDIQRQRSKIKAGFFSSDLKEKIRKLDRQMREYQNSFRKISDFFEFANPDDTIQAVKDQVSVAAALIDPPKERKYFSAKMREEKKEGTLCFRKDSFLNMALESLKQSMEILKAYDRADDNGFPIPDFIRMPQHQEQISNRMRFVGSNYKIGPFLGQGAWGKVNVIDLEGKQYAIKRSISDDRDEGYNNVFDREILAPLVLEHENIIKISAVFDGNPILEFIPTGSLEDYFKRGHFLKDSLIVEVLAKIASGLSHMHEKGLIHKDIKPANILLKFEGNRPTPLIIDFGTTVPKEHFDNHGCAGTELYMSPEMSICRYKSKYSNTMYAAHTPAIDVWALGHLIYEMVSDGSNLFDEKNVSLKLLHKKQGNPFNVNFLMKSDQERRLKREKMLSGKMKGNVDPVHKNSKDFVPTQGRENPLLRMKLFEIAADCLRLNYPDRPSCKEVEHRLLELKEMLEQREAAQKIAAFAKGQLARSMHI